MVTVELKGEITNIAKEHLLVYSTSMQIVLWFMSPGFEISASENRINKQNFASSTQEIE